MTKTVILPKNAEIGQSLTITNDSDEVIEVKMSDQELLTEYQAPIEKGTTYACLYELIDKINLLEFLSHSRDGAHTIRTNQDKLEQALRKLHGIVMLNYKQPEIQTIEWPIK